MNREPLIRVTKRDGMPLYKNILIRACSIVMAMLLVVFFVHLTAKISAGETLSYMWEGVFADVGVTLIAVLNSMRALKTK